MVHIILHFLVPAFAALIWYERDAFKAWLVMAATMVIDVDHLLADPVYDPLRCSIGFHLLHSYVAISLYVVMLFIPKVRLIGVGLIIHMALDYMDCLT